MADPSSSASRVYLYFLALIAAIGGFLFGFDLSIVSGAELFMADHFELTPESRGFAVGCAVLGCMIGPPLVALGLSDWLGRKKVLFMTALLFGVSSIGTALPDTIAQFNVFRVIGGIGVGIAAIVSPMYIAEIAPARIRGSLVTVNQLAIVSGSLVAALVAYSLTPDVSGIAASECWRWMFGSECIAVAILLIGLTVLPESPRWLVQQGRDEEARRVMTKVGGAEHAERELNEISSALAEETGSFRELTLPGVRIGLFVAVSLAMLQQFTGVSSLMFFTPRVFQMAGFESESDALLKSSFMFAWNLGFTVLALVLVDRLGRRPLLLIGVAAMGLGLFLLGLFFHHEIEGYWPLAPLFIAVAAYNLSLAPLAWLIMSEIFPNRIRSKAMAIASMAVWVSAYLGAQAFPVLVDVMQKRYGSPAGTFWIYSLVCLFALFFSWTMVNETKGKSLEEIGRSLMKQ